MALSVEDLKYMVDRRVDVPGMRIEVRTYDWDTDDTVVTQSKYYCFTRILQTRDNIDGLRWKLPGSNRFLTFGAFGVAPPLTTIEVQRSPDRVKSFALLVEPDRFRSVTGLGDGWFNERLMHRLNKEGVSVIQVLGAVITELTSPGPRSEILLEALATEFLIRFARIVLALGVGPAAHGLSEWQMNRIREMVSSLPANQVSVTRLAEACGISNRHLMRGFKAVMGVTVHRYIEHVRMERTKHLLCESRLPLNVVAAEVGFASASHMWGAFARDQGIAPSIYRQRHRS